MALLHTRIDDKYCADGPILLHTMCQHINCNHLAFIESVKNKIRSSTLVDHNNDVPSYLRFLRDNLKLISSTGASESDHNVLLPHLLLQLGTTTIPVFQQTMLKWQHDYYENNMKLTPVTLVSKADQECQVLQHVGQWLETIDPSVTALNTLIQTSKQQSGEVFHLLAANFSQITKPQKEIVCSFWSSLKPTSNTPDWLLEAPDNPEQIKYFNGRYWHYCTKCGLNGRWVCTHTDVTHSNVSRSSSLNSHNNRSRTPDYKDNRSRHYHSPERHPSSPHGSPTHWQNGWSCSRSPSQSSYYPLSPHQASFCPTSPATPVASLSLLASINDFLAEAEWSPLVCLCHRFSLFSVWMVTLVEPWLYISLNTCFSA